MILVKLILIALCFAVAVNCSPVVRNVILTREAAEKISNIDDMLAVAKSPLEPVTVAMSLPGARTDNQSDEGTSTTKSGQLVDNQQTSRAVSIVEQEQDTASSETPAEPSSNDAVQVNQTVQTISATSTTSEPPEPEPVLKETAGTETPREILDTSSVSTTEVPLVTREEATTASNEGVNSNPTTTTTTSSTTTTTPTTTPITTPITTTEDSTEESTTSVSSIESGSDSKDKDLDRKESDDVTSTTETIRLNESTTLAPSDESSTNAEVERTSSLPTTTELPSTTTLRPIPSITELSVEVSSVTTEKTLESSTQISSDNPKVAEDSVITDKPIESSTAPEQPTTTELLELSTTESPTTTTTTTSSITTSTLKPEESSKPIESDQKEKDDKDVAEDTNKPNSSCDHLPSYDTDELQKVFREETTYKNGTIKGKFTYVNFDQRYRLVHYTRLPYGPVKIDLVEELGKPEKSGQTNVNSTNSPTSSDIPNAILQLRNIIPNSLFGFPFLAPSNLPSNTNNQQPSANNKELTSKDDKSNQYFYSTDSISTPNLLTPSVPVSILPGQQKPSTTAQLQDTPVDTLSHSLYDNLPIPAIQKAKVAPDAASIPLTKTIENESIKADIQKPIQQVFQYAVSSPTPTQQASVPATRGPFFYNYLSQPQPQSQYQYSPLPPLNWQNFYASSARGQQALLVPAVAELNDQTSQQIEPLTTSRAHQPHSHEHFIAPFMFTNPRLAQQQEQEIPMSVIAQKELLDQPESRLKLRVKTSKSLYHSDTTGKSAQLKTSQSGHPNQQPKQENSGSYLQSSVYDAVGSAKPEQRPHRHRSGKQQFEVKTSINSNPIVYHVLRSPIGKMYTLDQYNKQPHAIAYDHDE